MNRQRIRELADTIEANPEYYDQGTCPWPTDTSCGCIAHFAGWLWPELEWPLMALQDACGLDDDIVWSIWDWRSNDGPKPTARQAAAALRKLARTGRWDPDA